MFHFLFTILQFIYMYPSVPSIAKKHISGLNVPLVHPQIRIQLTIHQGSNHHEIVRILVFLFLQLRQYISNVLFPFIIPLRFKYPSSIVFDVTNNILNHRNQRLMFNLQFHSSLQIILCPFHCVYSY